jgi:hypothetical protein
VLPEPDPLGQEAGSGLGPGAGTGDDVVLHRTTPPMVDLTHSGKSNFSVLVMTNTISYPDLAVNQIGKYSGQHCFRARRPTLSWCR